MQDSHEYHITFPFAILKRNIFTMMISLQFLVGLLLGTALGWLIFWTAKIDSTLPYFAGKKLLPPTKSKFQPVVFVGIGGVVGLVFALNAWFFGENLQLVYFQVMSFLLLSVALYDLAFRVIPIILIGGVVGVSFLCVLLFDLPMSFWPSLYGGLTVGGLVLFMYLLTRGRGIGEADIFIALVIGFLFGWSKGLVVFSAANVLGLIVMLPLMALLGRERTKYIPLAFFLSIAIFLQWYFLYAERILSLLHL